MRCVQQPSKMIELYQTENDRYAIAIDDGEGRRQFAYLSEETRAEMITWFLDIRGE